MEVFRLTLCLYNYSHVGMICTSWGPAGRLSGGSIRTHCILGDPNCAREVRWNLQAAHMQNMISILLEIGGCFSVDAIWILPFLVRMCA